jgi:hypothetical protein
VHRLNRLPVWRKLVPLLSGAALAAMTAWPAATANAAASPAVAASNPANPFANVDALACTTKSVCFATGYAGTDGSGIPNASAIARSTNAGATFTSLTFPKGYVELTAVACPTTKLCLVAADKATGPGVIVWTANATAATVTWHATKLSGGAQPFTQPKSITCPTKTLCYVAGAELAASGQVSAIEKLTVSSTAATATAQQLPLPNPATHTPAVLYGISCASATSCLAVGGDINSTGGAYTLVAGQWYQATMPNTAPTLYAVSCKLPTATAIKSYCSVGGAATSNAPITGVLYSTTALSTAPKWVVDTAPSSLGGVFGLSCVVAKQCLAAGNNTSNGNAGVAGTTNQKTYASFMLPPKIGPLDAATCFSATLCLAAGLDPTFTKGQIVRSTNFSSFTASTW